MLESLPLLFIPNWLLILLIVVGVIFIGFAILKRLIKFAIFVAIIILIIIGIRAVLGS